MKRQFLMPSALGIVLMLCLLTVQASLLRGTSQSVTGGMQSAQTDHTYGVPTLVRIVDTETRGGGPPVRKVIVGWDRILASIIVAWCLCMPIGRWVTGYEKRNGEFAGPLRKGWAQPAAIVGYVVASCVVFALIIAAALRRYDPLEGPAELVYGCFVLLMMVAVPVTLIVTIVRRWRYRTRAARRGFAVEMPGAPV
jgi:hypothetical protein